MQEYFLENGILKPVSNTLVTMVPKKKQPKAVRDFKPIAFCTAIYKVISMIISNRVEGHLNGIVGQSQAIFIPSRLISDNILLSHEFVKGYTKNHISPRCMIKVDLQKTYDSIEWPFFDQILKALGFSQKMIQWILGSITTMTYKFQLNGVLTSTMPAKRGLR